MTRTLWLALLALAIPAASVRAADDDATKTTTPPPATQKANPGTQKQVDKLASEFKVDASVVEGLRAQGLGWGEIKHALAISQKAGVPVADVMKLRQSGMGWGQIAKRYDTTVGGVTGKGAGARDVDREPRGDRDDGHASRGGGHSAHGGGRR